jgi:7,8-dihydroneopterin aldolase/epimerase/oxygenase
MTVEALKIVVPTESSDIQNDIYHVFIDDLILDCNIGVYSHEKDATQRVRINLDLTIQEGNKDINDEINNTVCYDKLIQGIALIVAKGHINLVETLAESIATMCLKNKKVSIVQVKVEKIDILKNARSAGVQIQRYNQNR